MLMLKRKSTSSSNLAIQETQDTIRFVSFISFISLDATMVYRVRLSVYYTLESILFTHPNSEPKNPLDVVNFFSASAINCNAFCSLSAIVTHTIILMFCCKFNENFVQITKLQTICLIFWFGFISSFAKQKFTAVRKYDVYFVWWKKTRRSIKCVVGQDYQIVRHTHRRTQWQWWIRSNRNW